MVYAGAVGLLALVAAAVAAGFYFHYNGEIQAYTSASVCGSPDAALQAHGCRFAGPVTVLSATTTDRLHVTVRFQSMSSQSFATSFLKGQEPATTLSAGTATEAELWSGKVTRVAGAPTADNPGSTQAQPFLTVAAFLAVAGLVVLGLTIGLATVNLRVK